jgi:ADP-heptose:LPS heptosyltransferase
LRAERLNQYVIINPGGGWPTKRWAPAKYGELASRIQKDLDLSVIVTTGPGEEILYQEIESHCPAVPLRHFPVSFLQLVPLLQQARLLIGGDTGPLHLACALKIPVVGIYGPTSPTRNGPWSDMDESVIRVLPCSFCYGRKCPTQNECMEVEVEEVYAAVARRLRCAN